MSEKCGTSYLGLERRWVWIMTWGHLNESNDFSSAMLQNTLHCVDSSNPSGCQESLSLVYEQTTVESSQQASLHGTNETFVHGRFFDNLLTEDSRYVCGLCR